MQFGRIAACYSFYTLRYCRKPVTASVYVRATYQQSHDGHDFVSKIFSVKEWCSHGTRKQYSFESVTELLQCQVSEADFSCSSRLFQHVRPDTDVALVKIHGHDFLAVEAKAYKNLAIANRSRVSCAHNTSRASIITPWPWDLDQGSLKVTGNGTIG